MNIQVSLCVIMICQLERDALTFIVSVQSSGKLKVANAFPKVYDLLFWAFKVYTGTNQHFITLIGLSYKGPKPLLYGTGLKWVYQPDQHLHEKLRDELREHYINFLNKNIDKSYIPMYLFLFEAGTGKSRNAD